MILASHCALFVLLMTVRTFMVTRSSARRVATPLAAVALMSALFLTSPLCAGGLKFSQTHRGAVSPGRISTPCVMSARVRAPWSQSAIPLSVGLLADVQPVQRLATSHRLPVAGTPDTALIRGAQIPDEDWQAGHRGVDLRAAPGEEIRASRGGTVHFAGVVAGTPVVSIQHSDGVRTTYEPVEASVQRGQMVRRGEVIGHLADRARLPPTARTSPGLSWGAKLGDGYVDPLTLLGPVRVRLYPASE